MRKKVIFVICLLLMTLYQNEVGYCNNDTMIQGEEVNEEGIYTIEELEYKCMINNKEIDIESYNATIRKYTLLNGKLDKENLEEQIKKLEKTVSRTKKQIKKINKTLEDDDDLPFKNPDKLTDEQVAVIEKQIAADRTEKIENKESVNDLRDRLMFDEMGIALLSEEEKAAILLDIEKKVIGIDNLEDSITTLTVTLTLDKVVGATNPYKMTYTERKDLREQREELEDAYDSYKKEIRSLKKQLKLLSFQNKSIDIEAGYDEDVMEALTETGRINLQLKVIDLLEDQYSKQLKKAEVAFYRQILQMYENGEQLGYADNSMVQQMRYDIEKAEKDIEHYQKNIQSGLLELEIVCGVSDISQIIIPHTFLATELALGHAESYLEKYIENSYNLKYMDEQIKAYKIVEEEMSELSNGVNDSKIMNAQSDKLKVEKDKLVNTVHQGIVQLMASYEDSIVEREKYFIDVEEAKRQYELFHLKYTLGYATELEQDEKVFGYEQLVRSETLYDLKLAHINTLLEGVSKGVLISE